ncbi:peptidylprolyl isomerase [Rhodobacteraceae bacterium LMO-12]|nr:peptidylprolyl isomerase [Rhodobacteraceae bacterium LMO-JJ12]
MSKRLSFLAVPLVALLSFAPPAVADEAPGLDTVVATVNGTNITLGHILLVHNDLPQQYRDLPGDVLFKGIVDQLVHQTLLEQSQEGGLPKRVELALDNQRRSLMAAEAVQGILAGEVTEDAINKAYEEKYAAETPSKEYRASHILVETEEAAQALVEELNGGADFATLAKEHSTGPSGPSGGDLGWFGTGRMVPEFENAVTALEVDAVSPPVKTDFGWHVIKLFETRLAQAPALDAVRDQIVADLQNQMVEDRIAALSDAAEIDRTGETGFDPAILKDTSLLEN